MDVFCKYPPLFLSVCICLLYPIGQIPLHSEIRTLHIVINISGFCPAGEIPPMGPKIAMKTISNYKPFLGRSRTIQLFY